VVQPLAAGERQPVGHVRHAQRRDVADSRRIVADPQRAVAVADQAVDEGQDLAAPGRARGRLLDLDVLEHAAPGGAPHQPAQLRRGGRARARAGGHHLAPGQVELLAETVQRPPVGPRVVEAHQALRLGQEPAQPAPRPPPREADAQVHLALAELLVAQVTGDMLQVPPPAAARPRRPRIEAGCPLRDGQRARHHQQVPVRLAQPRQQPLLSQQEAQALALGEDVVGAGRQPEPRPRPAGRHQQALLQVPQLVAVHGRVHWAGSWSTSSRNRRSASFGSHRGATGRAGCHTRTRRRTSACLRTGRSPASRRGSASR
jgi:hypothetical protein